MTYKPLPDREVLHERMEQLKMLLRSRKRQTLIERNLDVSMPWLSAAPDDAVVWRGPQDEGGGAAFTMTNGLIVAVWNKDNGVSGRGWVVAGRGPGCRACRPVIVGAFADPDGFARCLDVGALREVAA